MYSKSVSIVYQTPLSDTIRIGPIAKLFIPRPIELSFEQEMLLFRRFSQFIMKDFSDAVKDFRRARDRAAVERLAARLSSRSSELLSYEDVRRRVRASGVVSHTIQDVPLEAIVGSVSRYNDFTRNFLPRKDSNQSRWMNVYQAMSESRGLPPVELYRIGDAYFVKDGHHRVSVSRQMDWESIQAFVTEVRSKVPIDPTIQPDELIIKAEYTDFLALTKLDELFPEANLAVTSAGKYSELLEHIEVHRHYTGLELGREIGYEEAAGHWYETVYMPVVELINDMGLLFRFAGRTETDLYLWLGSYRAKKEAQLGWDIKDSTAAAALVEEFGDNRSSVIGRIGRSVLEVVLPETLEPSPKTGQWRREHKNVEQNLFNDILVPISGKEIGWTALEQAIEIAEREQSTINGLYVLEEGEAEDSQRVAEIHDRLQWRCTEVGAKFTFTVDEGPVARTICSRARWMDIVVFNLAYPPRPEPTARITSGVRKIISRCTRPILAVPGRNNSFEKTLLAFDGSPKSREALYVATYIAGKWQLPLIVAHVHGDKSTSNETIDQAQNYLADSGIDAEYLSMSGPVEDHIIEISEINNCDLIIVGGYGASPLMGIIRGSSVDAILRKSTKLTLVCQ